MKRQGPDPIEAILDAALHDSLSDAPDSSWASSARRSRTFGTVLLCLACVCIAAIALLPQHDSASPIGTLVLIALSILHLGIGAWLIDGAGRREVHARQASLSGIYSPAVDGSTKSRSQPDIRRQRHFGISMLVLAGFCVCVAAAPLPSRQVLDGILWAAFSIALVCVGAWQLRLASSAAGQAEQRLVAHKRISAEAGTHIKRVQ